MTRITTRLTAAVTAALIGLTLTACTSDEGGPIAAPTSDAPSTTPAPSASPSPSGTAAIAAPQRPTAMDDGGQAGAEAAALYFVSLDPYMQATGDTADWEALSHATCEFCETRLEQARRISRDGYSFSVETFSASVRQVYQQDVVTGIWPIDVTVTEGRTEIRDQSGDIVFSTEPETHIAAFEVARSDGEWVIVEVGSTPGD